MNNIPIYLYNTDHLFLFGITVMFLVSFFKPRYFVSFVVAISLIRPNERFEIPFSFVNLTFILMLLFLVIYNQKFREYKYSKDYIILTLFISFIILQTIIFHRENLIQNTLNCGLGFLSYLLVSVMLKTQKDLKILCYFILISAFLICFEPIYYHFTEPFHSVLWDIFHGTGVNGRLRAWGMWNNANETSFMANTGVISSVLILLSIERRSFSSILLYISFIIFFFLVICLSSSRTGLGCFVLIFAAMMLGIKSTPVKIIFIVMIASVVILAPMLTAQRDESEKSASSEQRADLRYKGIQLFKDYPLVGVGFNRARYDSGGMVLHNTYIQAFAETGLIGGGLFMYFIYYIGINIFRKSHGYMGQSMFNIFNGLLGIYMSVLLYFLFGNQLLSVMFFVIMTLIKSAYNVVEKYNNVNVILGK